MPVTTEGETVGIRKPVVEKPTLGTSGKVVTASLEGCITSRQVPAGKAPNPHLQNSRTAKLRNKVDFQLEGRGERQCAMQAEQKC